MGSYIRDGSFGTKAGGGWKENIKRGGGFPLFLVHRIEVVVIYHFSISSCSLQRKIHACAHRFSLKDKSSMSALIQGVSDHWSLTCFLLPAGVSIVLFFHGTP